MDPILQGKMTNMSWFIFSGLTVLIGFLYIIGVFYTINTIRKIHAGYKKGFIQQKECKDEYMEMESFRKNMYDTVYTQRNDLDNSIRVFVYLLFIIPIAFLIFIACYLRSQNEAFYFITFAVTILTIILLHRVLIDSTSNKTVFTYLASRVCDLKDVSNTKTNYYTQLFVFVVTFAIIYTLYRTRKFVLDPNTSLREGFSKVFTSTVEPYSFFIWLSILIWALTFIWVSSMTKWYEQLHNTILCNYPEQLAGLKLLLATYVEVDDNNYQLMRKVLQQCYFRVHQKYADIDMNNIENYAIYLMHYKGREFEELPESKELNAIRDFMYQIRTDQKLQKPLEGFLRWSIRYYTIQFVIIMYILFHVLYKLNPYYLAYTVIAGTIGLGFVLSWFSWFDTVMIV